MSVRGGIRCLHFRRMRLLVALHIHFLIFNMQFLVHENGTWHSLLMSYVLVVIQNLVIVLQHLLLLFLSWNLLWMLSTIALIFLKHLLYLRPFWSTCIVLRGVNLLGVMVMVLGEVNSLLWSTQLHIGLETIIILGVIARVIFKLRLSIRILPIFVLRRLLVFWLVVHHHRIGAATHIFKFCFGLQISRQKSFNLTLHLKFILRFFLL